jgi:hypothetical protein
MPFVVQKEWFSKEQIRENKDILFIFGDNYYRRGTGGQAKICRGEINCVGIVTKNRPSHEHEDDYLSDIFMHNHIHQIVTDFQPVVHQLKSGGTVIFPADGIGTGLAKLQEKAPLTFEFLQRYIEYVKWIGEQYGPK